MILKPSVFRYASMNKLFPFSDAPQQALSAVIQTWMEEHPIAAWLIVHPLLSVGLLLVAIILLRGLLGAIAQLTERIWMAILRFPMKLASWLFTSTAQLFIRSTSDTQTPVEQPTQQERLIAILARLEAIQQEQDQLLKEVREVLGAESV